MPDLARAPIRPTGDLYQTPVVDSNSHSDYLFVLEGTFRFALTGELIDAVYRRPPDRSSAKPHDLLTWLPEKPRLISQDPANHRYVFGIPENWRFDGQSLSVGLDVDALAREFLIDRSDVLNQLSGELTLTVQATPAAGTFPVWIGLPAVGMLAGTAWVIRRRRTFGGLDDDLARSLLALQEKTAAAVRIAAGQKRVSREVKRRLAALNQGAVDIAQRLQEIRRSLLMTDSVRTQAEISALETRLTTVTETTTRLDLEAALEQKRKALDAANDLRAAEERCRLRLSKIEGVVDSTCLHLQRANVGEQTGPVEDTVLRELDSEVRAVSQVAKEEEQQAYLRVR